MLQSNENKPENKPARVDAKRAITIVQTPREWETVINDPSKILEITSQNNFLKSASLKGFSGKLIFHVSPVSKTTFRFQFGNVHDFTGLKELVLYRFVNDSYIEIVFDKLNVSEKLIIADIKQARVAKVLRKSERKESPPHQTIASNFLVARVDIDVNSLGFTAGVIFDDINRDLKRKYPRSRVVALFNKKNLTVEEEALKKFAKPIAIANSNTMQSIPEVNCIDLKEYYEEELIFEEKRLQYRKESVNSFLYYPIIFTNSKQSVVIGYCYNESVTEITPGNIEYFEVISYTITRKIIDSSTVTIDEKINIVNLSDHGLLLEVNSPSISEAIRAKPSFSADIIFKMMVPMRFSFVMRHIYKIENTYYIGAEITGSNNEEKGFDKYKEVVKSFK